MKKTTVDVVIVGAQRSGTTWLARMLEQHPSIALAQGKEAHLFDRSDVQKDGLSGQVLAQHFPGANGDQLWLDATPSYLYLAGSLEALKASNPDAKVIALLRDPGQRAVSHYYHSRWLNQEPKSLLGALFAEPQRLRSGRDSMLEFNSAHRNWSYLDRGKYHRQIRRLSGLFPHAMIIPFPKIMSQPRELLIDIQRYLGIEVTDLEILPIQNNHGTRARRPFISRFISLLLRTDTRSTLDILGWQRSELREGTRS